MEIVKRSSRSWKYVVLALISVLFFVLIPVSHQDVYMHLLIMMAIFSIVAASFRMMLVVGRFSLGQNVFIAAGGYTSALLTMNAGINPWLGSILGGLAGAILALLLGAVILRVPGMYFAMITIGLMLVMTRLLYLYPDVTGGTTGLSNIPPYAIGSYSFGTERMPYYYLIIAIALVSFLVLRRIDRSPLGMIMHATGQNDQLVEHLGVNVARVRLLIFVITAFLTAVAGSFMAHYLRYTSPDEVGLMTGIYFAIYVIVGGTSYFWGPVAGVVFLEAINHFLGIAIYQRPFLYGGVLIITFVFLPRGLLCLPERVRAYVARKVRPVYEKREWGS